MAAMLVVMNKLNSINFSSKLFVKSNFIDHQHDCPVAMWLQRYKQGDKPTEEKENILMLLPQTIKAF